MVAVLISLRFVFWASWRFVFGREKSARRNNHCAEKRVNESQHTQIHVNYFQFSILSQPRKRNLELSEKSIRGRSCARRRVRGDDSEFQTRQ